MYLTLSIAFAFLALFFEKRLSLKSPTVSAFTLLLLVCFIGLKYEVGTDWDVTYYNFIRLTSGELSFDWVQNPLYSLISQISFHAGFSVYGVYVACAAIFCVGLFSLLSRLSRPWLSLCCFYPYYIMVFSFNFDRQSAALGLVMLGFSQLLDSRRIRFILLLLLASLFHSTALILLPLLFAGERLTSKSSISFISTFLFVVLASIPFFYAFISSSMHSLTYNYFGAGLNFESNGVWLRLLPLLFSAGLILLCRTRLQLNMFQSSVYSLMACIVVFLCIATFPLSGVSTIIDRLSAYASPLLLFAASESPKLLKNNGVPSWFVVSSLSSYSVAMTVIWLTFSF